MAKKQKVNLVVEMYGGTIQGIAFDNKNVEIDTVVFTEKRKYVDSDIVEIRSGPIKGDCIYTVTAGLLGGPNLFKPVMAAAKRYENEKYDAKTCEGCGKPVAICACIPAKDEQD